MLHSSPDMPFGSASSTTLSPSQVLVDLFDEGVRTVSSRIAHVRLALSGTVRDAAQQTARCVLERTSLGPLEVDSLRSAEASGLAASVAQCRPAVHDALQAWGLSADVSAEPSLLVCRGARFHHDAMGFADTFFVVLWLGTTPGLELVFPHLDVRVPLEYGTLVVFDSTQPHGVLPQGENVADASRAQTLDAQCFLSWDVPVLTEAAVRWFGLTLHLEGPPDGFTGGLASAVSSDEVCERTGAWRFPAQDRWPRAQVDVLAD